MKTQDTTPVRAIGYIRVSTDKQNTDDRALQQQAERVRQACLKEDFELQGIYSDTSSAVGPHSLSHRPELQDALRRAEQEQLVLVVPDATRLFRDEAKAKEVLGKVDVKIYSVRDGRILGMKTLLKKIADGEKVAEAIRDGSRAGLAKKKAAGKATGTITARSNATEASARARGQKSDLIVERIAAVLGEDPAYQTLTHKALADLLNRRRIHSGWDRTWTETSIRTPHRRAKELLIERQGMEAELDAEEALGRVPDVLEASQLQTTEFCIPELPVPDDDETEMKKLEHFGMF